MSHGHARPALSASRLAFVATTHCLTGCAIGQLLGLGGATALGLRNAASFALGIVLACALGYGLRLARLVRAAMPLPRASGITFAAETLSITTMEIVDNVVVLAIPGRWTPVSPTRCFGRAPRSRSLSHSWPGTR